MATDVTSYKCPSCGAPIEFSPGSQKVNCDYCGTEFDVSTIEALYAPKEELVQDESKNWDASKAGSEWTEEEAAGMHAFVCPSCGAEIVADANTAATECVYCGNPTVLPGRFAGMLKPDFIIPFEKTKEEAVAALKEFYKGKKLLPSAFTSENRMQEIQSLYVPFWLFNCDVSMEARFKACNDIVIDTEDETITETSHYACDRFGSMSFEKIPVDGATKMDDTYMEAIEPFDYSKMVPFSTGYLPGNLVDKYDVDAEQAVPRADKRVENTALRVLEDTVTGYNGGSSVEESKMVKDSGEVKYAMVPVWILTTKFQGKPYTFMMNGQTGKLVGSLPVDKNKLLMYSAASFIVPLIVLYLIFSMIF